MIIHYLIIPFSPCRQEQPDDDEGNEVDGVPSTVEVGANTADEVAAENVEVSDGESVSVVAVENDVINLTEDDEVAEETDVMNVVCNNSMLNDVLMNVDLDALLELGTLEAPENVVDISLDRWSDVECMHSDVVNEFVVREVVEHDVAPLRERVGYMSDDDESDDAVENDGAEENDVDESVGSELEIVDEFNRSVAYAVDESDVEEEEEDVIDNMIAEVNVHDVDVDEHVCPVCRETFRSDVLLAAHSLYHTQAVEVYVENDCRLERCTVSAMNGLVRNYRMLSENVVVDIPAWMREHERVIERCLSPLMRTFVVRAMMYVVASFVRVDAASGDVVARTERHIPSRRTETVVDVHEWYEAHVSQIACTMNKFMNVEGSEWQLEGLSFVLLKVTLSEDGAGRGVFQLPEKLRGMRAVVNVDCDRACFKYAVLSMLHYNDVRRDRQRMSKYAAWENELKFDGLNVDDIRISKDIPRFEVMNDVKVNVHLWDRKLVGILYNNRKNTASRTVNLLLVVGKDGQKHYCGIPQLSRLYFHTANTRRIKFRCDRCTQAFAKESTYLTHYEWCSRGKLQIEMMPETRVWV